MPISQTKSLVTEIFTEILSEDSIVFTPVEGSLGFIERSGQDTPLNAYTTVVRYRISSSGAGGNRGSDREVVIDKCRDLFRFVEMEERDVYSLAIMNNMERDDEFIILERYKDRDTERLHLESPKCVTCLKEIKGMIVGHDSRSYQILDV